MKIWILLLLPIVLWGCKQEDDTNKEDKVAEEVLIENDAAQYKEWYPGKKQVKIIGGKDEQEKKHGVWYFYSEKGKVLSMTEFEHGLRTGVTTVYHGNGTLRFTGQYANDKKVGIWKTYNDRGELVSTDEFNEEGIKVQTK